MTVHDPIYGEFRLSREVRELLRTPEVRRLSQVRLLNALTPTLATLGDLRRYSHTLGVLYLAQINDQSRYSAQERSAFAASVVLHDIGTPPFGHLMEYHLKERCQWTHENVIRAMLWGFHAPENRAHQIFAGRTISVRNVIRRTGLSMDLIQAIITREHPLANLLFGTLDLDNLDNVIRMAWALGLRFEPALAIEIARALTVSRDGKLLLSNRVLSAVEQWAMLRRKVYDILIFDTPTVGAQAVLSEAIGIALEANILGEDDWSLYDEALLERLRAYEKTKQMISQQYLGALPSLVFALQIAGELADYDLRSRAHAKAVLEETVVEQLGGKKPLAYVFVDRGTFEKRLEFVDPASNEPWTTGVTSRSLVLYVFSRGPRVQSHRAARAAETVAAKIGAAGKKVIRCIVGDPREKSRRGNESQLALQA